MKTRNKLLKKGVLVQIAHARGPGAIGVVLGEHTQTRVSGGDLATIEYFVKIYWTDNGNVSKFWDDQRVLDGSLRIIHEN